MNDKHERIDVIFAYTRARALADGVLFDVTEMARETGFRYPVVVTSAVWLSLVEVPPHDNRQADTGHLWTLLRALRAAVMRARHTDCVQFTVEIWDHEAKLTRLVRLKALCGPGDNAEPVITVMFPDED